MALYNNGYPATYTPMYQAYSPVPQQSAPQASAQGALIWVQGEAGAKSYLVAPNTTVALYDSENQTIYLKSADASGMPSMKILDYTIRDSVKNMSNSFVNASNEDSALYATKNEINGVYDEIKTLREKVDTLMKRRRREVDEDE